MMLLTLIENALKHGLGPLPEGGAIKRRRGRGGRQARAAGGGYRPRLGRLVPEVARASPTSARV